MKFFRVIKEENLTIKYTSLAYEYPDYNRIERKIEIFQRGVENPVGEFSVAGNVDKRYKREIIGSEHAMLM